MPHAKLKDYLTNNKIYFETLAAVSISATALVVSGLQFYIAQKQNSLVEMQTAIAEAQALPQFDFDLKQVLNQETEKYDDNKVEITNSGGPVYRFRADFTVLFHVNATRKRDENYNVGKLPLEQYLFADFYIVVPGYFFQQGVSSASKGLLTTVSGRRNNAKFIALANSLRNLTYADNSKWSVFNIDQEFYANITYQDLLNRFHKDTYQVSVIGPSSLLSAKENDIVKSRIYKSNSIDIDALNSNKIIELTETAMKNSG